MTARQVTARNEVSTTCGSGWVVVGAAITPRGSGLPSDLVLEQAHPLPQVVLTSLPSNRPFFGNTLVEHYQNLRTP
ncbi:MAG: hypothetical protein JWM21_1947 [Acidobacteria bacterium]|nr:hypothetical protein [Acidobacteriota bacterium]